MIELSQECELEIKKLKDIEAESEAVEERENNQFAVVNKMMAEELKGRCFRWTHEKKYEFDPEGVSYVFFFGYEEETERAEALTVEPVYDKIGIDQYTPEFLNREEFEEIRPHEFLTELGKLTGEWGKKTGFRLMWSMDADIDRMFKGDRQ